MKGSATWVAVVIFVATPAFAEQATREEAGEAQGAMIKRVSASVERYADSIGIDRDYIGYCRVRMGLLGDSHPKDGSIPFGIDYNNVDRETLKLQIDAREVFERGFLTLCLAESKNTLQAAARR